jgi:type II secretory pathway component PulF
MEQIFKDFKTELPGITKLTLAFGRWFTSIGWLVLLPIPLGVPFLLRLIPQHHVTPELRRARIWRLTGFTMLALVLISVWFALATLMPMVSLIQTVSAPKK